MPEPNEQPTPQQPLNPELMGYPSVEALVAAKKASDAEGKRLFDENQKKDLLLSQMLQNGLAEGTPRQSVPDRRSATPEDRMTEFGVPVDALKSIVRAEFAEAFRPISNGLQARGQLVASHPDYVQFETDVAQFINTDPELSASYPKMFEVTPVQAMEYAFLKFTESRRKALGGEPEASFPGRADAGIPTSRSGDGRREPGQDAAVQQAFERFQKTGTPQDAQAYAKARLKGVISDEFLQR